MEQTRLEYEKRKRKNKHGYDTFNPDTVVPTPMPLHADDDVPIEVAPALVVQTVPPEAWDHEFIVPEAYQSLRATDWPSESSVLVETVSPRPCVRLRYLAHGQCVVC